MDLETVDVPLMSRNGGTREEMIDPPELAARWRVPESWIRSHTRARTPREKRIPCVRLGRYVRFRWGSAELEDWLEKQRG